MLLSLSFRVVWLNTEHERNPFQIPVLAIDAFTRNMVSMTKDPQVAEKYSALASETGAAYDNVRLQRARRIHLPRPMLAYGLIDEPGIAIVGQRVRDLKRGPRPLHMSRQMEDKWSIFLMRATAADEHRTVHATVELPRFPEATRSAAANGAPAGKLVFARSWTGHPMYTALLPSLPRMLRLSDSLRVQVEPATAAVEFAVSDILVEPPPGGPQSGREDVDDAEVAATVESVFTLLHMALGIRLPSVARHHIEAELSAPGEDGKRARSQATFASWAEFGRWCEATTPRKLAASAPDFKLMKPGIDKFAEMSIDRWQELAQLPELSNTATSSS